MYKSAFDNVLVETLDRLRIAFTANGKREIRVMFSRKNEYKDENSAK